jgi:peroxiredoxin
MIDNVPSVTFKMRVRDESIGGDNPYRWEETASETLFGNKKTLVFSLPGAFTPTCSTFQLPDFEKMYPSFQELGIDEIYCMSVNDAFVMNAWARTQNLVNVKVIPDGSGEFTRQMGMLVAKDNLGFGMRSWRYAVLVDNMTIQQKWVEPNKQDNAGEDPYGETSPQNILLTLRAQLT